MNSYKNRGKLWVISIYSTKRDTMRHSGEIIKAGLNLNEMYENQVALPKKEKSVHCHWKY